MLPKRRRVRAGSPHSAAASSTPPAARFPGVAIYLVEPRMGHSRRAFLTRLARSKGFRILDAYRCAAPARAGLWWDANSQGAAVIMPVTTGLTVAQGGSWHAAAVTASSTCGFEFQANLGTSRLTYGSPTPSSSF